MKILVTGGPVGANLDPVKIVTNRFRGGWMAQLADDLLPYEAVAGGVPEITYLTAKGAVLPRNNDLPDNANQWIHVVYHDGFHDYMAKACELAKEMDAVIMGAAVANLIPVALFERYYDNHGTPGVVEVEGSIPMPLTEKFPSHNYKPGDRIFMEWTIAPRVIDEMKKHMPKHGHLFGFKLLAGQPHDELIRAAYEVLLGSGATAVIANDPKQGLETKHIVTKERGVHTIDVKQLADWLWDVMEDEYYRTVGGDGLYVGMETEGIQYAEKRVKETIAKYQSRFVEVENGMKFGTVAWRVNPFGNGFVTTGRGKKELDETVYVWSVNHPERIVHVRGLKGRKATLNAPLLDRIFDRQGTKVQGIVHLHEQVDGLPTFPYAPPGTVRDSMTRPCDGPFNIEGHGCFLLLDRDGNEMGGSE